MKKIIIVLIVLGIGTLANANCFLKPRASQAEQLSIQSCLMKEANDIEKDKIKAIQNLTKVLKKLQKQ